MKTKNSFILLIILGAILYTCLYRLNHHKNETMQENTPIEEKFVDKVSIPLGNGFMSYVNPTIGLSFEYPVGWHIESINDNPITHGDIVDGPSSWNFNISLMPPDLNTTQYISIFHSPLADSSGKSYDNLSIKEQFELFYCAKDVSCEVLVNKNKVKYLSYHGILDKNGTYGAEVYVPTGKYIMHFGIISDSVHNLNKHSPELTIFSNIMDSIKLQ